MNIAMLTNNYKPFIGGVPISIERLSNGLRAIGCKVYIFAPSYHNHIEEDDVIRFNSYRSSNGNMTIPDASDPFIRQAFKTLAIDIIHVHHPMFMGWTALHLGKQYQIPVVCTYHTRYEQYLHNISWIKKMENLSATSSPTPWTKASSALLKKLEAKVVPNALSNYLNRCEMVFAPTPLMKEILMEQGVREPIAVLPTGLDPSFFEPDMEIVKTLRKQFLGDKQHLFCSVSRLEKEKNIPFLLEGLKHLKAQIGNTFKMLLIGSGALQETLQHLVADYALEDNVVFISHVDNAMLKNYYKACDLFLFASKSETQGIVLLEAMANHTPVVAIEATGVVDVVRTHYNGMMTTDDLTHWVASIIHLLNHPQLLDTMKENAHETATHYLNETLAKKALCYYEEAISTYKCNYNSDHALNY